MTGTTEGAIPRTVLVTGATGFVGRHVCARLLGEGARVRGLVRGDASALPPGVEPAPAAGLADREGIARAVAGADAVVHLAARVHVLRERDADPAAAFREVNEEGTRLLADEAGRAGVGRFVFVSSLAAVGIAGRTRLDDASEPRPESPYGLSKLRAEAALREGAARHGMRGVILRPPGIYGPGMKGNIPRLFAAVSRGIPLPVPRENRRTLLYVGNLVGAIVLSLASPFADVRAYLVADAEAASTADLVRMAAAALGRPARMIPVPVGPMRLAGRLGDLLRAPVNSITVDRMMASLRVDASAIRRDLGYAPPFTLEEGMRRTGEWFVAERSAR